jgi:hypothetical protein
MAVAVARGGKAAERMNTLENDSPKSRERATITPSCPLSLEGQAIESVVSCCRIPGDENPIAGLRS